MTPTKPQQFGCRAPIGVSLCPESSLGRASPPCCPASSGVTPGTGEDREPQPPGWPFLCSARQIAKELKASSPLWQSLLLFALRGEGREREIAWLLEGQLLLPPRPASIPQPEEPAWGWHLLFALVLNLKMNLVRTKRRRRRGAEPPQRAVSPPAVPAPPPPSRRSRASSFQLPAAEPADGERAQSPPQRQNPSNLPPTCSERADKMPQERPEFPPTTSSPTVSLPDAIPRGLAPASRYLRHSRPRSPPHHAPCHQAGDTSPPCQCQEPFPCHAGGRASHVVLGAFNPEQNPLLCVTAAGRNAVCTGMLPTPGTVMSPAVPLARGTATTQRWGHPRALGRCALPAH